jgi:predicted RNA binding protein YcfA (HicA-like mRNA interferase family)
MRYSTSKDVNEVVAEFVRSGWRYVRGRKHGRLVAPGGRSVTIPISPSDHRVVLNLMRDIRHAGRE